MLKLLLCLFLMPIFGWTQKLEKYTISESRLMYDETAHLFPGKRLDIGIHITGYKKKPDKLDDFYTPNGFYTKGNIGWGEFEIEIEGGKFNKSKGQLIVDEDISLKQVHFKITNRFHKDVFIEQTLKLDYGGEQELTFEAEKGEDGNRGANGGNSDLEIRINHSELKDGEDGFDGLQGSDGDSLEVFVSAKVDNDLGEMLFVQVNNLKTGAVVYRKLNPNANGFLEIISKGGRGGKGGKGGKGENMHSNSSSVPGRGGDGGEGANGGSGGIIVVYIDESASKYKEHISLKSVGGDPGEFGPAGAPGRKKMGDKYEYGPAGRMGLNGKTGVAGPEPQIKFVEVESDW